MFYIEISVANKGGIPLMLVYYHVHGSFLFSKHLVTTRLPRKKLVKALNVWRKFEERP